MYTRFTSSMKNRNQLQSATPLTDEQIMQVAPSIFAEAPWEEVSDKYTFIPTSVTLAAMRKEGICKLLQERINDFNGLTFEKIPELFGTPPAEVWESGVTVEIKP